MEPTGVVPPSALPGRASGLPIPTTLPQPGQSLLLGLPLPDYAALAAPPARAIDDRGRLELGWMREESERIYEVLRSALTEEQRSRVAHVPFHVVDDAREPNAAAGCTPGTAQPLVFVTSAMLVLAGAASEARALDELGGTAHLDAYAEEVVRALRAGRRIEGLGTSASASPLARDPRKLARQRHLFVQQVAFILGHELAHHHRGHTGCARGTSASREDAERIQRGLAQAVPTLEQPSEIEADAWGTTHVLEAGHADAGGAWTVEGALLNLEVFRHLGALSGAHLESVFLSTHPPSELRGPIVRQTAAMWTPGRAPLPTPTFRGDGLDIDLGGGGAPIHIPIPFSVGRR
jgi:hypothetical protein